MASTVAGSVNLAPMAQGEGQDTEEWISPIGRSVDDLIAEEEERDPEYKLENERNRPRRELARVLMIRRIELDLSQQELADRMGTSVAVVSRLERGRQNFSPATLKRLAEALDTRLVYTFEPTDRAAPEYVDSLVVVP
ncbi:MAG TPA: helix-turn-helix transcriptional regulator [Solirubrobacterales bacterium]|nr:helix-turn-helix transcriptional regulator [Solirubrobacterales bacterium]